MDLAENIKRVGTEKAKAALHKFLMTVTEPAFGSLSKRETELAIFNLLRDLDIVATDSSLYGLMTELRITRAKATQILFDLQVRELGSEPSRLDAAVSESLTTARLVKDGTYFVIEIENPLVLAYLRDRIRRLGHISDSSFNSALVRMPLAAVTDLIAEIIPEEKHEAVRQALIKAGAPNTSIKGVINSSLKKLGSKVVGEVADGIVDDVSGHVSAFLNPLLRGAKGAIANKWSELWVDSKS